MENFRACFLPCGDGDSFGYHHGSWEFAALSEIRPQLDALGGCEKIELSGDAWMVSDDTVMHMASGEGMIAKATSVSDLLRNIYRADVGRMGKITGRAPGIQCINALRLPTTYGWKNSLFSPKAGGCGASMRSMCIGLRFWRPEWLTNLIVVSIESGRMTHHHPTGYMGGVASAVFASYALQKVPVELWGMKFRDEVIALCNQHISQLKGR